MFLRDLFDDESCLTQNQKEIEVKDISIDLNSAKNGDLFFDLKGDKNLNSILKTGVSFVIRLGKKNKNDGKRVFSCPDVRERFAIYSKKLNNCVCDKLKIIGITGTNGKTSIARLISDILKESGKNVGIIGTMGGEFCDNLVETGFTTPDPHILHKLLRQMYSSGIEYVVMEVSAHAIALKKIEGIKFEVLCLTNITQDHLDFFGDIETYAKAKMSIFTEKFARQAVLCIDDDYARKLTSEIKIPFVTYGVENPSDVFAIDILKSFSGSDFICNSMDEVFRISTKLVGDYNVLNCLCAISVCSVLGISPSKIVKGVENSQPELGRFNTIVFNGVNVVIDYAHTPDGLEKVLQNAKELCDKRLLLLFGCGGNRDRGKRPLMGSIALIYADKVFLTSDNPRFEDPIEIIKDIESEMFKGKYVVIPDRAMAIQTALSCCERGDCLIIAGKGGEKYQDIKGVKIPYNDFDEVHNYFRKNLALVGEKRKA